jgi:undecaprenyl-diphosphatase
LQIGGNDIVMSPSASVSNNEQRDKGWKVQIRSYWFAGFVALFLALAILVAFHLTDGFDMAVARFFHDIGSAQFDGLMIGLTLTGDLTTVLGAAIILTILRKTRKLGLAILISLVATSILLMYIKPIVARPLPRFEFQPHIQLPDKFTLEQDVVGFTHAPYSFPSGHETLAVSLSFLVGFFISKRWHRAVHIVWVYPVLVGISRLYVSAHYPFDLFASAALGIAISYLIVKVLKLDKDGKMSDSRFAKTKDLSQG